MTTSNPISVARVARFHVTILSNFARAFDKYALSYSKAAIPESTYPDQFFLLEREDLAPGIAKATALLARRNNPHDRLLVLETSVAPNALHSNQRTGIGQYVAQHTITLAGLHYVGPAGELVPVSVEEAYAASLSLLEGELQPYSALRPRTFSVLPIAQACQARCRFCFSEASVSAEQRPTMPNFEHIAAWAARARAAGAERFVITGGGEPGVLPHEHLVRLMAIGSEHFRKVVLITNGIHLWKETGAVRRWMLDDYRAAGLSVLSVSSHHHDRKTNHDIMGADTNTWAVLDSLRASDYPSASLTARLICVLQKGGIDSPSSLEAYVDWASEQGVEALCFKELYVSSTLESAYHPNATNQWSREHQVSLSLVTTYFEALGFTVAKRLPWGAPIYVGQWKGRPLAVAAYTEPTVFWERHTGVARSWNLMADGRCLVSLEDPRSDVDGNAGQTSPVTFFAR
ncbi:radical SAM protein [Paraburkholderia sp. UCT31]|uniref:radical SAM protein n=1 Tax=Paraburkholderia sp. UCT31 TaxID=2615209 RepID=UPI001656154C|nr:radical SAM protein [Paraburkholderia sp. UCT31]MBC8737223.1 radical SAM protein [Paraburkholderia sp. UCT31]